MNNNNYKNGIITIRRIITALTRTNNLAAAVNEDQTAGADRKA
jgi:hypothetical protein